MPTVTFTSSTFPPGTSVSAYPEMARRDGPGYGLAALPPAGASLGSGTVDGANRVAITVSLPANWSPNAPLVAYAQVAGEHKYVTAWAT